MKKGAKLVFVSAAFLFFYSHGFAQNVHSVVIDWTQRYQQMDGFGSHLYAFNGTSAAYYTSKNFITDYQYDLENSMVRFAIEPSFCPDSLSLTGMENYNNYNISLGKNNDSIFKALRKLQQLNPEIKIIGSVWSPPGWMKTNNSTINGGSLQPSCYGHFARFLHEFYRYLKEVQGVTLYAISPQNELRFVEPYNSCVYTPDTYRAMLIAVGEYFESKSCPVKFFGPEDMAKSPEVLVPFVKKIMEHATAKKHLHYIASHGYVDGVESANADPSVSMTLYNYCKPYGLPQWMTETSGEHYEWDDSLAFQNGKPMKGALGGLGLKMHVSMVYGYVQGWTYWAFSTAPGTYSFCSRSDDKKYRVHQHYSKFIRPGAFRVDASPDRTQDVWISAYYHPVNKTLTLVLLNMARESRKVNVQVRYGMKLSSYRCYQTTRNVNFESLPDVPVDTNNNSSELNLPERSITTLVALCDSGFQGQPAPAPIITCDAESQFSSSAIKATLTIDKNYGYWSTIGPDGPFNKFDMTYNMGNVTLSFSKTDTLWFYASDGVSSSEKQSRIYVVAGVSVPKQTCDYEVFPNPTSGFICISQPDEMLGAEIINLSGQTVIAVGQNMVQREIPIDHLPVGLYVVRIKTAGGYVQKKFLKN